MPMKNSNYQNKIVIFEGEQRLGAAARSNSFMATEDFTANSEPILTIDKIGAGECVLDQGRREDHDVIFFAEKSVPGLPVVRPLIVNSTNRKTLMSIYGDLSADVLMGKRIRLYVDPHVRAVGGGYTSGIRIRKLVPPEPAQPVQPVQPNPVPPAPESAPVHPSQTNPVPHVVCSDCGSQIVGAGDCDATQVLQNGFEWFGAPLCAECQNRRIAARNNNNQ